MWEEGVPWEGEYVNKKYWLTMIYSTLARHLKSNKIAINHHYLISSKVHTYGHLLTVFYVSTFFSNDCMVYR